VGPRGHGHRFFQLSEERSCRGQLSGLFQCASNVQATPTALLPFKLIQDLPPGLWRFSPVLIIKTPQPWMLSWPIPAQQVSRRPPCRECFCAGTPLRRVFLRAPDTTSPTPEEFFTPRLGNCAPKTSAARVPSRAAGLYCFSPKFDQSKARGILALSWICALDGLQASNGSFFFCPFRFFGAAVSPIMRVLCLQAARQG